MFKKNHPALITNYTSKPISTYTQSTNYTRKFSQSPPPIFPLTKQVNYSMVPHPVHTIHNGCKPKPLSASHCYLLITRPYRGHDFRLIAGSFISAITKIVAKWRAQWIPKNATRDYNERYVSLYVQSALMLARVRAGSRGETSVTHNLRLLLPHSEAVSASPRK